LCTENGHGTGPRGIRAVFILSITILSISTLLIRSDKSRLATGLPAKSIEHSLPNCPMPRCTGHSLVAIGCRINLGARNFAGAGPQLGPQCVGSRRYWRRKSEFVFRGADCERRRFHRQSSNAGEREWMAARPAGVRIRCDAGIRPSQTATVVWWRLRSRNSALELQRACRARGALSRTRRRGRAYEYEFPSRRHFELQLHRARRRGHAAVYKASPVGRHRLPMVAHLECQLRSEKPGVQRDSIELGIPLVQIGARKINLTFPRRALTNNPKGTTLSRSELISGLDVAINFYKSRIGGANFQAGMDWSASRSSSKIGSPNSSFPTSVIAQNLHILLPSGVQAVAKKVVARIL
jgi:hypothetical protein